MGQDERQEDLGLRVREQREDRAISSYTPPGAHVFSHLASFSQPTKKLCTLSERRGQIGDPASEDPEEEATQKPRVGAQTQGIAGKNRVVEARLQGANAQPARRICLTCRDKVRPSRHSPRWCPTWMGRQLYLATVAYCGQPPSSDPCYTTG